MYMLTHGISVPTHDSTHSVHFFEADGGRVYAIRVFGCGLLGCSGLDVCKFIIILY